MSERNERLNQDGHVQDGPFSAAIFRKSPHLKNWLVEQCLKGNLSEAQIQKCDEEIDDFSEIVKARSDRGKGFDN